MKNTVLLTHKMIEDEDSHYCDVQMEIYYQNQLLFTENDTLWSTLFLFGSARIDNVIASQLFDSSIDNRLYRSLHAETEENVVMCIYLANNSYPQLGSPYYHATYTPDKKFYSYYPLLQSPSNYFVYGHPKRTPRAVCILPWRGYCICSPFQSL